MFSHDRVCEQDFDAFFSDLVKTFSAYAAYDTKIGVTKQKYLLTFLTDARMHLAGLKAIHSIVANKSFFLNPKAQYYSIEMIPSILSNISGQYALREAPILSGSGDNLEVNTDVASLSKRFSIQDELITPVELTNIADLCIIDMISNANMDIAALIINWIYEYFDSNDKWANLDLVLHVIQKICDASLPGIRYSILVSTIQKMELSSIPVSVKYTLLKILNTLIRNYPSSASSSAVDVTVAVTNQLTSHPNELKNICIDLLCE